MILDQFGTFGDLFLLLGFYTARTAWKRGDDLGPLRRGLLTAFGFAAPALLLFGIAGLIHLFSHNGAIAAPTG